MTCNDDLVSIFRHGINNDDIGPIAKASFEETPERFLNAARHAELDTMRGVSANVMCGQEGYFGTSAFQVILDYDKITELKAEEVVLENAEKIIEMGLEGFASVDDACSIGKLTIHSNAGNIKTIDMGADDGYELNL
jgi:DNA-directed RNA polymerase II subunit RPB1